MPKPGLAEGCRATMWMGEAIEFLSVRFLKNKTDCYLSATVSMQNRRMIWIIWIASDPFHPWAFFFFNFKKCIAKACTATIHHQVRTVIICWEAVVCQAICWVCNPCIADCLIFWEFLWILPCSDTVLLQVSVFPCRMLPIESTSALHWNRAEKPVIFKVGNTKVKQKDRFITYVWNELPKYQPDR